MVSFPMLDEKSMDICETILTYLFQSLSTYIPTPIKNLQTLPYWRFPPLQAITFILLNINTSWKIHMDNLQIKHQ